MILASDAGLSIAGHWGGVATFPADGRRRDELLAGLTATHSIHVAILTVEIARELGLEDALLDDLRTAARLHDIGKLAVPDAILNKPGPLDEDELRVIRTRSVLDAELLRSWGLLEAATIVHEHHERIDGSGYPGLRGDRIGIGARIVHAADAYVAMMIDRPYYQAMKQDEAFAELQSHCGTQFDADVVAVLIAVERARPTPMSELEALASAGNGGGFNGA